MALAGVTLNLLSAGRYRLVEMVLYVAMGWLVLLAVGPLMKAMRPAGLSWLAAGGLCYTGGVAFYLWKKLPFRHTVWHLHEGGFQHHRFGSQP
jgi:hemolysin III